MIRIGVIGYGYWGPNIVRNFHTHDSSEVVLVCDKNPKTQERLRKAHPGMDFTTDENDVLKSPKIDLIAVVTPVWTHYELAKKALENGKHVFVEKPFTCSVAQAEELIELADRKKLKIMVDHTFLFTGAVKKIRQLIDEGRSGQAVLLRFAAREPGAVSARCQCDLGSGAARSVDHGPCDRRQAGCRGGHRRKPFERHRGRGVHHRVLPATRDRAHQCELALARKGAHHLDRRREEDAGVERSGSRRKNQGLRQGREHVESPAGCTSCWSAIAPETCGRRRSSRSKRCARKRPTS